MSAALGKHFNQYFIRTDVDAVVDLASDLKGSRLFPNALEISGLKHICDNTLSDSLKSMPWYETYTVHAKSFELLLTRLDWRERLVFTGYQELIYQTLLTHGCGRCI